MPEKANEVMALSTPESDVELARRQREGVFVPPPHWKPRQEEVDLKKDYAFKRAQREGGVFDPVEVTNLLRAGAARGTGVSRRSRGDLNPFTETGAALRRLNPFTETRCAPAQEVGTDRRNPPRRARDLRAGRGPAEPGPRDQGRGRRGRRATGAGGDDGGSVDDGGASSPLRAVREEHSGRLVL